MRAGTAFQSDVGMCGDYESVIGMNHEEPLRRFLQKVPGERFTPADGPATLAGIAVEVDDATGLAPLRSRRSGSGACFPKPCRPSGPDGS